MTHKAKNINLLSIKDIKVVNNNLQNNNQDRSNFNQSKIKNMTSKIVIKSIKESINYKNNKIGLKIS